MLNIRKMFVLKVVLSLPIQLREYNEQPTRGNFADTWSEERLEYARVLARLNTMMKQKRKIPAPKPVLRRPVAQPKPVQPAYVQAQFRKQDPGKPYYRTLTELDTEGRFRRQNFAAPNATASFDFARGKNKKNKKNQENLDYEYTLKDFSDYYPGSDAETIMLSNSEGHHHDYDDYYEFHQPLVPGGNPNHGNNEYGPYGHSPFSSGKLSPTPPAHKRDGDSSTMCWTCHVDHGENQYTGDMYAKCIDEGALEYCQFGQDYCQTEERKRNGFVYQLKTGCKQPLACMNNWDNNFKNMTHPECDPESALSNYSACRQCCGGDNIVCDFSTLSDPDNRYQTPEDWANTDTHGYLTSEKIGILDFDPENFRDINMTEINEMMSNSRAFGLTAAYGSYYHDQGQSRVEEFEPTTTEWITTTTTTTQFPTTEYTTMFEYETTVEPTTVPATTTTYLFNTVEITADPSNPLTPLSELVQSYYEEAVSGNSTLTAEELRFLIKVLREQAKPVPVEAYQAYEEYADDYKTSE